MNTNSQYFSKEQVKSGDFTKFLITLMEQSYSAGDTYNDIHIRPEDCGAFIIEWIQLPWSHDYGGNFQYIEEDQVVMTEYRMPDGVYVLYHNEADYKEGLEEWLKENPGWEKNSYGIWYNINDVQFLDENLRKNGGNNDE